MKSRPMANSAKKSSGTKKGSRPEGRGGNPAPKSAAKTRPRKAGPASRKAESTNFWILRLYVAGQTSKSMAAFSNLQRMCEEHLQGRYSIEVVDLLENPKLAAGDQILAIPTLVRRLPPPMKKIIGDLSNEERVLVGLDIRPIEAPRPPSRKE